MVWQLLQLKMLYNTPLILVGPMWCQLIDWANRNMLGGSSEMASAIDVRDCVRDPETALASEKDAQVHLFYRRFGTGYCCVVVGGELPAGRFVITAYFTRKLKEGTTLWTK
jgi:hypothetical protein